jgi:hypothetical protein
MLFAMPYLALIDEQEVEFADEAAVAEAVQSGRLRPESWIMDPNVEAGWETIAEKFPELG